MSKTTKSFAKPALYLAEYVQYLKDEEKAKEKRRKEVLVI